MRRRRVKSRGLTTALAGDQSFSIKRYKMAESVPRPNPLKSEFFFQVVS